MKVMIVVTHLLGTGHLARALTLGRAFRAAGDSVTLISGGMPVPHFDASGLELVQLSPVRSNGTDFTTLMGKRGAPATVHDMNTRRDRLLTKLAEVQPDILITELFPFGRRILRDEFRDLLGAAQAMPKRPLILSSIRDILAPPGKASKVAFADDLIARFYDGVLVHADPDVIALTRSWPVSAALAAQVRYTGFVAPEPPAPSATAHGTVLVSAGGGDVGDRIFDAALDAAYLSSHLPWLFLMGGRDDRRDAFVHKAPSHVSIEPPRPDFRTLLQGAAASVSMCGYNTALDVLQTGVPAVLIPFDDGGEVEQGLRADALSVLDGIEVLRQNTVSGAALVAALDAVQAAPRRAPRRIGMNGAARSVDIAHDLRARQAP